MIALQLKIQDHYFEFLVLVVDILDEYDFIIGLEVEIQLEAVYHMTLHIVNIQSRSVPLFSNKDIKISPGTSTSIQLSGDLPCTFTSGTAIIRVQAGRKWIFIQYNRSRMFRSIYLHSCFKKTIFTKMLQSLILISDQLDTLIHHKQ